MERIFCRRTRWSAALLSVLVLARPALADEGGAVALVIDATSKRPIPGVSVVLIDRNGANTESRSDVAGEAVFDNVEEGFYSLRASSPTHNPVVEPRVRILPRRVVPIRVELRSRDNAIDEVVVVERARGADPYGSVSSSFYNRDELRNNPGTGSDVMRALDGLPGIASTGDFASFSVRGRGPRNNLIFVDDFPLDKVVHFDQSLGEEEDIGGGGRFSIFAPNSITAAEFSPGGWSAAYGGRSGSLLNLNVAGGGPTPVTSLRVDLAGAEVAYEGPSGLREGTSMFLTARQFDFGRVFDTIDELDIGEPTLTDIIFKTSSSFGSSDEVETLVVYAGEEFTRDIDNVLESENFDDVSLVNAEQDLALVGLTWRRLIGDDGEWTNRLYLRDSEKTSAEGEAFPDTVLPGTAAADIPVRERIITIDEDETELGWRSDLSLGNRFGRFSAGLRVTQWDVDFTTTLAEDWIRYIFESGDPRPPGQGFVVWTPDAINNRFSEAATNAAAYVEQTFEAGAWTLRPGIRLDRDGFSEQTLFSPRLSVNYDASASLRVSATAGVFYESPRFLTRAGDASNGSLQNEEITHFSLGAEWQFGDRWSLLAEAYYQELDNLVVDEGRANGRAANVGDGSNVGADVVVNRRFANGWSGNLTYSYNRQRLNDNNGLGEYTANFSREHFFTASARWEISDRWQLAWRWKYGSGRPDDEFRVLQDVQPGSGLLRFGKEIVATNAATLDDYHSLNMRVDYRRPIGPVDLVAFLDIVNVYGGPNGSPLEFNYRNGQNVIDEDSAFPIIGLIFERSW